MEKQDRRVIRSKMRMREALISLMQEKLFPEITARILPIGRISIGQRFIFIIIMCSICWRNWKRKP